MYKDKSREAFVHEFHEEKAKRESNDNKNNLADITFQLGLLIEEVKELEEEISNYSEGTSIGNKAALLKELCDVQYTLSGVIDKLGFNYIFPVAFVRVHKNNMSKIEDGIIKDATGKILKPANYKPVVLEDLFE